MQLQQYHSTRKQSEKARGSESTDNRRRHKTTRERSVRGVETLAWVSHSQSIVQVQVSTRRDAHLQQDDCTRKQSENAHASEHGHRIRHKTARVRDVRDVDVRYNALTCYLQSHIIPTVELSGVSHPQNIESVKDFGWRARSGCCAWQPHDSTKNLSSPTNGCARRGIFFVREQGRRNVNCVAVVGAGCTCGSRGQGRPRIGGTECAQHATVREASAATTVRDFCARLFWLSFFVTEKDS